MTPKHPNRRMRAAALALATAMALAACGGSNDRVHEPGPGGGTMPPPPPVAGDSFFAQVVSRVAALLDNDEPVAIDSVTATTPETTEPEPLPAT